MLRIKEVLKENNLTQVELAEMMKISAIGLNKIINGNPTVVTLFRIAKILDVDIKDLFLPTKKSNSEMIYVFKNDSYVPVGEILIKDNLTDKI